MDTNPKGHRVALVLVLVLGAVAPCLATVLEEDLSVEDGFVRSFTDDFTDAYVKTILVLQGADGSAIRLDYLADGEISVGFWDQKREYELPDDGAAVEVVFRVDALEPVTLTGTWSARYKNALATVSEVWVEELADMVFGAETIIFRVGSRGEILRVPVPAEMPELVAEFRRRVAEAAMASGDE